MSAPKMAITPIAISNDYSCTATPRWFVDQSEYHPLVCTFQPLVNGENAFASVYHAIASAKKSVSIICWGFQPSMHFLRGPSGGSLSIGQLLENKALENVTVRILCFAVEPTFGPRFVQRYVNLTGWKPAESNTPGRHDFRIKARPPSCTDAQYKFDVRWFTQYDEDQEIEDVAWKKLKSWFGDKKTKNIHFRSRGFSNEDRASLAMQGHADPYMSALTKGVLAATPSHHQKMVLVDHEDPAHCVGFVMGHNMLDEYWDTSTHSYFRHKEPDRGRNGLLPRHDFSSRVTGPIVGDLFRNFANAWKKETGETLHKPNFSTYPPSIDKQNRLLMAQLVRTQPQYGVQDIKKLYLQAINNASQYIYIENQYFRWPPLAEKIKACAAGQTSAGRQPQTHGPLYLFVITNADKEGMGPGVKNTYRMLESLGRADTLPEVTKLERADDANARLGQTRNEIARLEHRQRELAPLARRAPDKPLGQEYSANKDLIAKLKAQERSLAQEVERNQAKNTVVIPKERPGLKVHVCTLVSPDTPGRSGQTAENSEQDRALTREQRTQRAQAKFDAAENELRSYYSQRSLIDSKAGMLQGAGSSAAITRDYEALSQRYQPALDRREAARRELEALKEGSNPIDWVDVYIHAKLMLIDDAFMTLGSANINSRSMEVDTELNISHHRPEITQPLRKALWGAHTNHRSGGELMGKEGMEKAYNAWQKVIDNNKDAHGLNQTPIASLCEFYSGTTDRTDLD